MFRSIAIEGLGPHASTALDFDPSGPMTVSGPSQSGKSLLITALCWCLWGVDATGRPLSDALLRAGEPLQVSITTGRGTVFTRTRTGMTVTPPGEKAIRCRSQVELAPHLKALADAQLGRLILAPMAWLELAEGPGEGRPLREFLDRVLPGPAAGDLLDRDLVPGEPRDPKGAERFRRDARRALDEATGALGQAKATPIGSEPVRPDPVHLAAARELVAKADEAIRYNDRIDTAAWRREADDHAAATRTHAAWVRRREDLERTRPTRARIAVSDEMLDAAAAEIRANDQATARAAGRRDAVMAHRFALKAFEDASAAHLVWTRRAPVPPPGQAPSHDDVRAAGAEVEAWEAQRRETPPVRPVHPRGWIAEVKAQPCSKAAKGCQIAARAQDEADERTAHNEATAAAWEAWEASRLPEPVAAREVLRTAALWAAFETARAAHAAAEPSVPPDPGPAPELLQAVLQNAAQEAVEDARAVNSAWTAFEAAAAALGEEPPVPGELRPAPQPVPVPEIPAWARAVIQDDEHFVARHRDWKEREAQRDAQIERLSAAVSAAAVAADRAEVVIQLVRTAPGRALAAKLSRLPNTGPVTLEVGDDSIRVLVDGRPWRVASTGARIVADVWLRCALREAVGMTWLPVIIDEWQSVGGIPLQMRTPAWFLETTASGGLAAVRRG